MLRALCAASLLLIASPSSRAAEVSVALSEQQQAQLQSMPGVIDQCVGVITLGVGPGICRPLRDFVQGLAYQVQAAQVAAAEAAKNAVPATPAGPPAPSSP